MTRWNRRLLVGAAALLIPVLAGCEAGLDAPTLAYHAAANGTYKSVNGLQIDNVFVLSQPASQTGGRAGVFMALYSPNADTLTSVSAPGAATSAKITGGSVSLTPNQLVNLQGPAPKVVLSGLTKPLSGGDSITLVLNFSSVGAVTLQVPVESQSNYYATYSAAPRPSATKKPRKKAKAKASASASATSTASATPTPSAS